MKSGSKFPGSDFLSGSHVHPWQRKKSPQRTRTMEWSPSIWTIISPIGPGSQSGPPMSLGTWLWDPCRLHLCHPGLLALLCHPPQHCHLIHHQQSQGCLQGAHLVDHHGFQATFKLEKLEKLGKSWWLKSWKKTILKFMLRRKLKKNLYLMSYIIL